MGSCLALREGQGAGCSLCRIQTEAPPVTAQMRPVQERGKTTSSRLTVGEDTLNIGLELGQKKVSEDSGLLLACKKAVWPETGQLFVSRRRDMANHLSRCPAISGHPPPMAQLDHPHIYYF